MNRTTIRAFTCLIVLPAVSLLFGCTDTGPEQQKVLIAEMPLYLKEHLDAAHIEGSKVPDDFPKPVEWRFDEPQPDWKPVKPFPELEAVKPVRVEDALRMPLTGANRNTGTRRLLGQIFVELPDWNLEDWAYVEIRARTRDPMLGIGLFFNYTGEPPPRGPWSLLGRPASPCDRRHGPDVPTVAGPAPTVAGPLLPKLPDAKLGRGVDAPGDLVQQPG
ncbi:MAG TPA: hypothetical protein ENI27_01570 [bacterium]|nr:hypothetical protein [bacterium]